MFCSEPQAAVSEETLSADEDVEVLDSSDVEVLDSSDVEVLDSSDVEVLDSSLDSTLPYAIESQESTPEFDDPPNSTQDEDHQVYRVGWTSRNEDAPELLILSDSEDELEIESNAELWTHVYHSDLDPAPYAESHSDPQTVEEIMIDSESDDTQTEVSSCILLTIYI